MLVDRYSGLVWSVARGYGLARSDAADVVQTTWLRLVENLHRLRQPERVGAWLASTTRHECVRALRRATRERPTGFPPGHAEPRDTEPSAETLALDRVGRALVLDALAELSQRCRALLLMLAATPPPSYADVAGALDMPIGSIGPSRARCLNRLREGLAKRDSVHRHES